MSIDRPEPTRWKAEPNPRTTDDLWLRDAFRAVAPLDTPDEIGLERIWRALTDEARPPQKRVTRRWVLVVAGFILGASAGALAAIGYYTVHRRDRGHTHSSSIDPSFEQRGERRWRVRTKGSAEIEVALSHSKESLAVVAGQAEITVPEAPAVELIRGSAEAAPKPSSPRSGLRQGAAESDGLGPTSTASRPRPAASTRLGSKQPAGASLKAGQLPLSSPRLDVPRVAQRVEASSRGTAAAPPSEGALLAEALSSLRGSGDAKTALDRLGLYAHLYPHGRLAEEAALVRAEALFRSGDDGMALAQLDRLPMADIVGARPLILLRGELRAARGRYRDAVADFDVVFQPQRPDELSERALYTRAACRERLGETGDARSDVETYLRVFPLGSHRAEAWAFLTAVGGPRAESTGSP